MRARGRAPLVVAAIAAAFTLFAGCGGASAKSRDDVAACLHKAGLVTAPPLSALVNPSGFKYELNVSLAPGTPVSPSVPEATIDMFDSSGDATSFATGGEWHKGPAVVTTTAVAPQGKVRIVEGCVS